jgi:transcriptional regulator of acetoin/glycerol metabolism|tara:strand:- start:292 stop:624 length:333 start_codon:yes stop_codon:yes gene_type:complete
LSSKQYKNYSLINKLRKERRINEDFINVLSSLTLEELIGLKLEQTSRLLGGKLFNFPIWKAMPEICRAALFKFALSVSETKKEASRVLGIDRAEFYKMIKKHGTETYFDN